MKGKLIWFKKCEFCWSGVVTLMKRKKDGKLICYSCNKSIEKAKLSKCEELLINIQKWSFDEAIEIPKEIYDDMSKLIKDI